MPEYIIKWNAGFGEDYDVIEADSEFEAKQHAEEVCRDAVESEISYGVVGKATDKLLKEYGLD